MAVWKGGFAVSLHSEPQATALPGQKQETFRALSNSLHGSVWAWVQMVLSGKELHRAQVSISLGEGIAQSTGPGV